MGGRGGPGGICTRSARNVSMRMKMKDEDEDLACRLYIRSVVGHGDRVNVYSAG